MNQKPQEVAEVVECCEDYPLGVSLEPYDIWRDLQGACQLFGVTTRFQDRRLL